MDLNSDQQAAFHQFQNSKHNLFITGPAGTGKSRVLSAIVQDLNMRGVSYCVLAPTAVSASVIDGQTWHSYFGVGILQGGLKQSLLRSLSSDERRSHFRSLDVLILDEVSFVREEELRLMSWILGVARGRESEAFGGVRVIFFGDFTQLPPVPRSSEDQPQYAFQESRRDSFYVWRLAQVQILTLRENMRTGDREFASLLEAIRGGRHLSEDQMAILKSRKVSDLLRPPATALRIYSTKKMVEEYNDQVLAKLPGASKTYEGYVEGVSVPDSVLPLPRRISLKIDAKVMVRRNFYNFIPSGEILNGDIAFVVDLSDRSVLVRLEETNEIVEIPLCRFEILDVNYQVVGCFFQIPITLAYAVTVHKAQGQTLIGPVVLNLSNAWLPGQVYVALSRVKTREQLFIEGDYAPQTLILSDQRVRDFYNGKYHPSPEWKQRESEFRDSSSRLDTFVSRVKTVIRRTAKPKTG